MTAPTVHHKTKKRNDIQGLRAIAITGVLLFHLFPKRFVNGFLGVDTFFVLSGYLMSSILSREPEINCRLIGGFYIRRFKRIVPIYSLMLAILTVVTPLIFLPSDINHFVTDLEWALPFAENMQNVLKKFSYWDEVFSSPIFLHAWSLGVEIQYYLIVPLVMIVARLGQTRLFRLLVFVIIMSGSYALHLLSSSSVSFGLLFSRVWQFLTGSVAFEMEGIVDDVFERNDAIVSPATENGVKLHTLHIPISNEYLLLSNQEKEKDENEDNSDDPEIGKPMLGSRQNWWNRFIPYLVSALSYVVTGYLLWMVIMSTSAPTISRFLVTFATGILLIHGKFTQNLIISNEIMVYFGDLSYLVYLVHWPVIILYKFTLTDEFSVADASLCVLLTLLVSVILYHSLERYFIQASTTFAVAFVAILYAAIVMAILTNVPLNLSKHAHKWDPAYAEAINYNLDQSQVTLDLSPEGCERDFEAEKWAGFKYQDAMRCISTGNGTAKVLVIGNSYGYRAFPLLHKLFAGRYAQMRMFTRAGRVFLTHDPVNARFAEQVRIILEKFKPDITFLIEKDTFSRLSFPIYGSVQTDRLTTQLHTAVDILSKNSGTAIIDRQYYKTHTKDSVAYTIQKRLQMGKKDLDDLSVSRKEYEQEFANEIARMATIKKDNVILNDVQAQLCPEGLCYFFNRDNLHSYYGDLSCHLTTEGLKMLEPKYSEIIEDFLL